jgi:hypothetical protein
MRDTGVITKGFSGDTDAAAVQTGVARTQLGILKNQMAFSGLQVGARTIRLADGTEMRVSVSGGVSRAEIYTPASTTPEVEQPVIETPQVEPPEIHPTVANTGLALFNGFLKGPAAPFYNPSFQPSIYNDALLMSPDTTPRLLARDKPVQIYDRPDTVLAKQGAGAALIGMTDIIGGAPLSLDQQPTAWTVKQLNGGSVPASVTPAAAFKAAGDKTVPAYLGVMSMPWTLEDVVMEVSGADKGKPVGQVMCKKNIDLAGTCADWYDPSTGLHQSYINGELCTLGNTVPTPEGYAFTASVNGGVYSTTGAQIVANMALAVTFGVRNGGPAIPSAPVSMVWTQTSGWPAGQTSGPNSAVNMTTLPTYAPSITYSGAGTFTVTDGLGNVKVIPASFALTVAWSPP